MAKLLKLTMCLFFKRRLTPCDCNVIPDAAVKFIDRPSSERSLIPLIIKLSASTDKLDALETYRQYLMNKKGHFLIHTLFVTTFVPRRVFSAVGMSNCTLLLSA